MSTKAQATVIAGLYVKAEKNQAPYQAQPIYAGTQSGTSKDIASATTNISNVLQVQLAALGTTTIDLSGTLEDGHGDAAVFTKVTAIHVENFSDVAKTLNDGNQSTVTAAQASISGNWVEATLGGVVGAKLTLDAGELFAKGPGTMTVTNSTADQLTVTNLSATEIVYVEVTLFGSNA